ncbi:unnamed protein product, partial [Scytosiphon promiscuus]
VQTKISHIPYWSHLSLFSHPLGSRGTTGPCLRGEVVPISRTTNFTSHVHPAPAPSLDHWSPGWSQKVTRAPFAAQGAGSVLSHRLTGPTFQYLLTFTRCCY